MFRRGTNPTDVQKALTRALQTLETQEVDSEEYAKTLEQILKLHKMREDEKPDQVSMDTAAVIAANILGILLIIRHEHVNVITSMAMRQVLKPR